MDLLIEANSIVSEADVELKVLSPVILGSEYLGIPMEYVKGKSYLSPTQLDKAAGKSTGYYPDFSIWLSGLPVCVIEAKAPGVVVELGYREASLYARHLNSQYKTGLNPCQIIIASNGTTLVAGHWDGPPSIQVAIADLVPGSTGVDQLRALCGYAALEAISLASSAALRTTNALMPYNLAGGVAFIRSKKAFNTFAADLAPLLRRYFTSTSQNSDREIYEYGYVATDDVTTYDKILESLLKDRMGRNLGPLTQDLAPTRRGEPKLSAAIDEFKSGLPAEGQLQLIIGGVGSGKSLFSRRYKELLQPEKEKARSHWAFVDFNTAPPLDEGSETWISEAFIASFRSENPTFDPYSGEGLSRIFAADLQRRKGIYDQLRSLSEADVSRQKAIDFMEWQEDPRRVAFGICQHFLGQRREPVIVVMDNVDKLDLKSQLRAFQLSLWFMEKSKSFVILQMRDETYERYKNLPPLDTFRTGVVFHISPPRFLDVVKRRLELSLAYLSRNTDKVLEYELSNGVRITYPNTMLGQFLRGVYLELFERKHNVARVLQGLAGRDVRKALEMFVSILNSGHLTTEAITSNIKGAGEVAIQEFTILRILMRTEYRFFSNESGVVSNTFYFDEKWERPNNFVVSDILFWLYERRKVQGQIGLEGYFTVESLADDMQLRGYPAADVISCCSWLLQKELVEADHMNRQGVVREDSVRVTAAGFIHLRVLTERIEYLYGVLVSTPMFDRDLAQTIADAAEWEAARGYVALARMVGCIESFLAYLKRETKRLAAIYPSFGGPRTGAGYMISQIESALAYYRNPTSSRGMPPNALDEY